MMLTDVTNHFWEQQRYRRCTGTVINSKRRAGPSSKDRELAKLCNLLSSLFLRDFALPDTTSV